MAKQNINSKKGFTIIEVVLVLAIAGLIFLMVFIAWPALQRSQRDTQRRNDYAALSTQISNYAANNSGKLDKIVTSTNRLNPANFINDEGTDPNGDYYYLRVCKWENLNSCGTGLPQKDNGGAEREWERRDGTKETLVEGSEVRVIIGADCTGTNAENGSAEPAENKSTRAFAIFGYLEGGTKTFCTASQ